VDKFSKGTRDISHEKFIDIFSESLRFRGVIQFSWRESVSIRNNRTGKVYSAGQGGTITISPDGKVSTVTLWQNIQGRCRWFWGQVTALTAAGAAWFARLMNWINGTSDGLPPGVRAIEQLPAIPALPNLRTPDVVSSWLAAPQPPFPAFFGGSPSDPFEFQGMDPYAVLGVKRDCDPEEIFDARGKTVEDRLNRSPEAVERVRLIDWACGILRDPVRRAEYDRDHPDAGLG
jgi:hypothetical protein